MARQLIPAFDLGYVGNDLDANNTSPVLVDGIMYPNTKDMIFKVKNGSGASINVTFITPYTRDGLALPDLTEAVAAGATKEWALHADEIFTQTDGNVYVDFSAVTTVTVKLLRA